MLGIPVFIDGIMLSIPTGSFEISEACAGLRFMIAIFALGLVYAQLVYQSWQRRIAFMVLAIIVTLVANSLRALGIVYLAYVTNHEVAIGADHLVYGWVFLSLVMLVLFLLGLTFRDRHVDVFHDTGPEPSHRQDRYHPPNALLVSCALGTLLLVVATSSYASRTERPIEQSRPVALETPSVEPPWVQEYVSQSDWRPVYVNNNDELLVRYRSGDRTADLFLAFYAAQRQGAEVINARNKVAVDNQWVRLENVNVDLEFAGTDLEGLGTIIQDIRGHKRLVVRWFWIAGRATASPVLAKLFQVQAVILDQTRAAAAVLVSVPMEEDVETAMNTARSLVAALPSLEVTLARAAGLSAVSSESSPAP
jgi:EpsI family protein